MKIGFENVLKNHAKKYPIMHPSDVVKLVYQSVFGGGHMISSSDEALKRINSEYSLSAHGREGIYTESLGETSRIYIDSKLSRVQLDIIARIFCASARSFPCGYSSAVEDKRLLFDERIFVAEKLCSDGLFAFGTEELRAYLSDYRGNGCPAVSHSEKYRDAYAPSYRVIDTRYVRLLDCIFGIADMITEGKKAVLAIDGRAASGKTTAAELIAELFNTSVIHMDDFFLPRELRTAARMAEVGGNIHYERFLAEVVPNLRTGKAFSHRVFDCSRFDFADGPKTVEPAELIICEGSYSLHPMFGKYYDIAYFSDIDPETQKERIRSRNGEAMLARFVNEWIPMEERYFASLDKSHLGVYNIGASL